MHPIFMAEQPFSGLKDFAAKIGWITRGWVLYHFFVIVLAQFLLSSGRILYHGTSLENCHLIRRDGFIPSLKAVPDILTMEKASISHRIGCTLLALQDVLPKLLPIFA